MRMTEQLDRLDQADLANIVEKAQACIAERNFACAEGNLQKAGKLARTAQDRKLISGGQAALSEEKRAVAREEEIRVTDAKRRDREAQNAELERQCSNACPNSGQFAACMNGWIRANSCNADADGNTGGGGSNIGAAMLQGLARSRSDYGQIAGIHNQAMANLQATLAERQRQEAAQRDRIRAERAERERPGRPERVAQANVHEQADAERQRREREEARARDREREEELARKAAAEQRQRQEQARAERLAKAEAEKAEVERSRAAYLDAVRRGTRLNARKCPDGEGKYYIVGIRPAIKPEVVSCVDLHYRAQCIGSQQAIDGIGKNFLGAATDCFMGDTYTVDPKPACKVEDVRVTVRDVRACGG